MRGGWCFCAFKLPLCVSQPLLAKGPGAAGDGEAQEMPQLRSRRRVPCVPAVLCVPTVLCMWDARARAEGRGSAPGLVPSVWVSPQKNVLALQKARSAAVQTQDRGSA